MCACPPHDLSPTDHYCQERKSNLYVGTTGYFQSYAITANRSLEYVNEIALSSECESILITVCVGFDDSQVKTPIISQLRQDRLIRSLV